MRTIGPRSDHPPDQIPASHRDLVQCPPVAALTTVMPDGYPQTAVVCYDPHQPNRYLEVRGRIVEMTQAGAAEHRVVALDATGKQEARG